MGDWLKDWGMRFWADFLEMLSGRPALELLHKLSAFFIGLWRGLDWHGVKGLISLAVEELNTGVVQFADIFTELAANTMNQIAGLGLDAKKIGALMNEPPGRPPAVELGKAFLPLVDNIFNIEVAKADNVTRNTYDGARENIRAYFGTNLLFQLRSLTISSLAAFFPYFDLHHLKALHESINWSFGMGWLSWSVMSAVMDSTTTLKLKQYYLSQVLPNDYSEAEARWAFWAGRIDRTILDQVEDNEGTRKDIRQALLDRAEADISDSDLVDFWQHQRVVETDIVKQYRLRGYGEAKATLKKDKVVDARLWDILDKIDTKYLQLYRDCVIDKIELQQWLQGRGWSASEQDAAVALQELDRRTRRWLSDSDLDKLLDQGVMDVTEVTDYLVCQGMTELDAAEKVLLLLAQKFPKEKLDKCAKLNPDDLLAKLLTWLLKTGGFTLPGALEAWIACLLQGKVFALEEGPAAVAAPAPKLPTGGISTLPSTATIGDPFRLVWNIDRADQVLIDNDIGLKGPQGTLFLTADVSRVYHLTAANEDGEKTFQASILVKPKTIPGPAPAPKPSVSIKLTPSSVRQGEQVAVEWESHNADQVFLDDSSGPRAVSQSGAFFIVADRSLVYTITASGSGGQTQRSDALVVRPAVDAGVRLPSARLSISPSHAQEGDALQVTWSTSNADAVSLEGLAGTETVAPSGIRIVKADIDRIVTLRARNVEEGTERIAQDAVIVEAPKPSPEETASAPTVSLTIRPSKAKPGATVAVEWRTLHADRITMDVGSGPFPIDPIGGDTLTADETRTIVLHAYGKGGDRAIAKVLVVE